MCGIVGVVDLVGKKPPSVEVLRAMRDEMSHRGPDGGGEWTSGDGRAVLGHRRLSIIDLSTSADQPMVSADGRYAMVFNGEIYNHAELRAELVALGKTRWQTDHSDTEVLLAILERWGVDGLHKLRGMFAIALWDAEDKSLLLVRDRIGVKPLYFAEIDGTVIFASEIKALLRYPGLRRSVNVEAMYHYLSFLTPPSPMTMFEGVGKLPAGTWRKYKGGAVEERQWWDPLLYPVDLSGADEEDICKMILSELRTAVQLRKVADVPVGVFLSGGIDSSTNAKLFSEGEGRPVKTFTIGYQGSYSSYTNEVDYARRVAEYVGAEHHELLLTIDDMINFLPQMAWQQDEPIADPVCVPVYYVSKLARDNGVVVCQVGEGADELFFGYEYWKRSLKIHQYNSMPVPRGLKSLGVGMLNAFGHKDAFYTELLRRGASGVPVFWGGAEALYESQKKSLLSPALRKQFDGFTSWEALRPYRRFFEENAREASEMNWMTYLDLKYRLPELLLMRVDKMSMAVSLEGRVPFLDHKFVELAMSIPSQMKLKGGTSKYLLKKALRGVIPDEIIDRKKQGFGVPVYEWFQDRLGTKIKADTEEFLRETDWFDADAVRTLVNTGKPSQVWYFYNLVLWWQRFIR